MSHPRFFAERVQMGPLMLSEQETRHARGSRRLGPGDRVVVFDGCGNEGDGIILDSTGKKHSIEVQIEAVRHLPRRTPELTLAVAIPKGPRQDWLIEKCTELGVRAIWPLTAERSISGASDHRLTKWKQVAIEAAKQSSQAWVPEFREPLEPARLWSQATGFDQILIATGSAALRFAPSPNICRLLLLIGPEGDWTQAELDDALAHGATAVSLGPSVLRIETAAIAAAALVHAVAALS